MRTSAIAAVSLALIVVVCAGAETAPTRADTTEQPRIELFEKFDAEHSPLQKGILGARDKAWSKNLKLGNDPRCGQLVRVWAKDPGAGSENNNTIARLCADSDTAGGPDVSREECLSQYCGADNVGCAEALILGDDIETQCSVTDGTRSAVDVAAALDCADEIFGSSGGPKGLAECLENSPFDVECEENDPEDCVPVLKGKCKNVFRKCNATPFVLESEKNPARSGLIKKGDRTIGKRIQTKTIVHYDHTVQRGKPDVGDGVDVGWEPIRIRPSQTGDQQQGVPGEPLPPATGGSVLAERTTRSAALFDTECDPLYRCLANDDADCYDTVTGEHYFQTNDPGESIGCFDAESRLRATLAFVSDSCDVDVCCEHTETGDRFYGDDCLVDPSGDPTAENLRTTLVQLVDEDPVDEINDDGDCRDLAGRVTSDCIEAGALREGFSWNVNEETCEDGINDDNDCMGGDGQIGTFEGELCVARDGNIIGNIVDEDFIQLIDEDCADDIDNDGDGVFGEDLPGKNTDRGVDVAVRDAQACVAFYGGLGLGLTPEEGEMPDPASGRGCDMTRAVRVKVNDELSQWSDESHPKHDRFLDFKKKTIAKKEKLFDIDDSGHWCDDNAGNCALDQESRGVIHPRAASHNPRGGKPDRSFQYEERRAIVDEVFGVKCKPVKDPGGPTWTDTYYDEASGNCIRVDADRSAAAMFAVSDASECESDECRQAMMGFTFAPPVLEWGWRVKEEVCVFGFCFEIFYARIGYEFDLAAGIRLPVEIQFDDVPESVLATESFTVNTSLEPLDFDTSQYEQFCNDQNLDEPWYIGSCERFAFPDFLDSDDGDEFVAHYTVFAGIVVRLLSIPIVNWAVDSSIDVPAMCTTWNLINGAGNMSLQDRLALQLDLAGSGDVIAALKNNFTNCGSFTTPFAYQPCEPGVLDPDCPLVPPHRKLRAWPFLSASYSIRADCLDALIEGEVFTFKGQTRPICTGLILGTHGASLGVGLELETKAGSDLITADFSTAGDAAPEGAAEIEYEESSGQPGSVEAITVVADNYDTGETEDDAVVRLNGFTYYLNTIELALNANLEFGGILSPIPDIGSFRLYSFAFSTRDLGLGRGIPIPQHPNTEAVQVRIPVTNYALEVDALPDTPVEITPGCELQSDSPMQCFDRGAPVTNIGSAAGGLDDFNHELPSSRHVDRREEQFRVPADGPAEITPACVPQFDLSAQCPDYGVQVTNIGSVEDGFDNFHYKLSNIRVIDGCDDQFRIDENNDHDCLVAGIRYRGDPFDGEIDDCYDECGNLRRDNGAVDERNEDPPGCDDPGEDGRCSADESDRDGDGLIDEDGFGDDWSAAWFQQGAVVENPEISGVAQHSTADEQVVLRISPLQHAFTSPGVYPFEVSADSVGAKVNALPPHGPGDVAPPIFYRVGAPDVGYVQVDTFFAPDLEIFPAIATVTPGQTVIFRFEATNGSNSPDSIDVVTELVDFNEVGCNLVSLGSEGCPYRAVPTAIPLGWIEGDIPDHFPTDDPSRLMGPSEPDTQSEFAVTIPSNWAGMTATVYSIESEGSSTEDPAVPPASDETQMQLTVEPTFESMTRYIGLEIHDLIAEIEAANAAGIATAGLHPIATHPILLAHGRAMERMLVGNVGGALRAHKTTIRGTGAFIYALEGSGGNGKLPEPYFSDWKLRAERLIGDLQLVVASGS